MKQMCGICNKNTSKEKYKKLNHLFKMKELTEIAFRKGLFVSIKGQSCLTEKCLGNQKGTRFNSNST